MLIYFSCSTFSIFFWPFCKIHLIEGRSKEGIIKLFLREKPNILILEKMKKILGMHDIYLIKEKEIPKIFESNSPVKTLFLFIICIKSLLCMRLK